MDQLILASVELCALLLQKGVLNEFEQELYEATAKFVTTGLKFSNASMTSSMLEVLDELRESGSEHPEQSQYAPEHSNTH